MATLARRISTAEDAQRMEVVEMDFHSLCRLCGNMNINLLPVHTDDGAPTELMQKIVDHLNISISPEDILPKKLCIHCSNTLSSWHSFYVSCQETNSKFHSMVTFTKSEEVLETLEEDDPPDFGEDVEVEEHIEFLEKEECEEVEENLDFVAEEQVEEDLGDASVFEVEEVPEEKPNPGVKIFMCEMCNRCFNRKSNLVRHLSAHTRDISCPVCCLSFATEVGLKQHSLEHNSEEFAAATVAESRVICSSCGDEFPSKFLLYRHERFVHDPGEGFTEELHCEKCPEMMFPSMELLMSHQKRHKEFNCDVCGKILRSRVAFKEHQNSHSGEKPFKCRECGKQFAYSSNLLEHRKIHGNVKRHKCGQCNKAFSRSNMLKEHERVHTKERPFKCSFCKADFTQSNSLKKHLRRFHRSCKDCWEYVGDDIDEMIHECSEKSGKK